MSFQNGIRSIKLSNYRNYIQLKFETSAKHIILNGQNGSGKTNLLEALSYFSPGRGLRRAKHSDVANVAGAGQWAASVVIDSVQGYVQLGTGIQTGSNQETYARQCRIEGNKVSSATKFADLLRVIWLIPDMDSLFRGPAADRRQFLDRLVTTYIPDHNSRLNQFEKTLRQRNRLLEQYSSSNTSIDAWLSAIEQEIAAQAVAIAAARVETITRFQSDIHDNIDEEGIFPWAKIALIGSLEEKIISQQNAADVEEEYKTQLVECRSRDALAGRTLIGPHRSDFHVSHGPKNIAATLASTGEQKALLLGLIFAHTRFVAATSDLPVLLLLDEVVAHLDKQRRKSLFEKCAQINAQIWMTGTDQELFKDAGKNTEFFMVNNGIVSKL